MSGVDPKHKRTRPECIPLSYAIGGVGADLSCPPPIYRPADWAGANLRTHDAITGVEARFIAPAGWDAYTGRFFETRWSPEAVILSAAKDLRLARREILRCAQDDTSHLAGSFPKKPTPVRGWEGANLSCPIHIKLTDDEAGTTHHLRAGATLIGVNLIVGGLAAPPAGDHKGPPRATPPPSPLRTSERIFVKLAPMGATLAVALGRLSLLAALLIALQLILPVIAFAAPARLATNPPSDASFARAEVSVVRLIVTYNTSSPAQSHIGSTIQCTGLGILVGSWLATAANAKDPYVNWVLTDATLLNQSSAVCAPANTAKVSIAYIDVLPNNVYTNTHPANTLGTLMCQTTTTTVCSTEGTTVTNSFLPVNASAMLFSFRSAAPQPFVDIATQDLTSDLTIRLTNAGGDSALSLIAPNNQAQSFLNPLSVPLNSNETTTSSPTISKQIVEEAGTPSVNAAGQVVSIQVGSGPLDVTQADALLKTQPSQPTSTTTTTQPTNLHTNPLRVAWNKGIDDFYAKSPNYPAAAKEFRMAAAANPAFQAATTFAIASDNGGKFPGQGSSTPVSTPAPTGSNLQSSPGIPWLPIGVGLFVLIILLVGIGVLARARAHQKELARFEADRHEVEMAAQRQQQARQAQAATAAAVNKASTPSPRPTSLPCPHCGQPARIDAPYCNNCHYVL